MIDWSDEQKMVRDAVRQFIEKEIVPLQDELEHGDLPPYEVLRKLFATFGMDTMARAGFEKRIEAEKAAHAQSGHAARARPGARPRSARGIRVFRAFEMRTMLIFIGAIIIAACSSAWNPWECAMPAAVPTMPPSRA